MLSYRKIDAEREQEKSVSHYFAHSQQQQQKYKRRKQQSPDVKIWRESILLLREYRRRDEARRVAPPYEKNKRMT